MRQILLEILVVAEGFLIVLGMDTRQMSQQERSFVAKPKSSHGQKHYYLLLLLTLMTTICDMMAFEYSQVLQHCSQLFYPTMEQVMMTAALSLDAAEIDLRIQVEWVTNKKLNEYSYCWTVNKSIEAHYLKWPEMFNVLIVDFNKMLQFWALGFFLCSPLGLWAPQAPTRSQDGRCSLPYSTWPLWTTSELPLWTPCCPPPYTLTLLVT